MLNRRSRIQRVAQSKSAGNVLRGQHCRLGKLICVAVHTEGNRIEGQVEAPDRVPAGKLPGDGVLLTRPITKAARLRATLPAGGMRAERAPSMTRPGLPADVDRPTGGQPWARRSRNSNV